MGREKKAIFEVEKRTSGDLIDLLLTEKERWLSKISPRLWMYVEGVIDSEAEVMSFISLPMYSNV